MSISAKRRWRSSEDIALEFLEEQGFKVIDRNVKVRINGVDVGEVDAVVEDSNGNRYAVEVKAGNIDVSGLRQIYVNAQLLNLKPMVVAKGFADESAEALAEKLGIKVYKLSDYFVVSAEELETVVRTSLGSLIERFLNILLEAPTPTPEEKHILEKMAHSNTIKDFAEALGITISEAAWKIRRLQNKGLLSKTTKNYQELRLQAQLIILRERLRALLNKLEEFFNQYSTS